MELDSLDEYVSGMREGGFPLPPSASALGMSGTLREIRHTTRGRKRQCKTAEGAGNPRQHVIYLSRDRNGCNFIRVSTHGVAIRRELRRELLRVLHPYFILLSIVSFTFSFYNLFKPVGPHGLMSEADC